MTESKIKEVQDKIQHLKANYGSQQKELIKELESDVRYYRDMVKALKPPARI